MTFDSGCIHSQSGALLIRKASDLEFSMLEAY